MYCHATVLLKKNIFCTKETPKFILWGKKKITQEMIYTWFGNVKDFLLIFIGTVK